MKNIEKKLEEVLQFWFEELSPEDWWKKSEQLDDQIMDRFLELHKFLKEERLDGKRVSPELKLAEIIVLDQFSRNIFRDTHESFSCDDFALSCARKAIKSGDDLKVNESKRAFFYMPYMHSEDIKTHDEAIALFVKLGNENYLKFEKAHRDIIKRFGRYPHRNEILGRVSTEEEVEFLKKPGSSF